MTDGVMPMFFKGDRVTMEGLVAEEVLANSYTVPVEVSVIGGTDAVTKIVEVPWDTVHEVGTRSRALAEVPVNDRNIFLWSRLAMEQPRHSPRTTLMNMAQRLEDLHNMTVANGWGTCTHDKCECGDEELISKARREAQ